MVAGRNPKYPVMRRRQDAGIEREGLLSRGQKNGSGFSPHFAKCGGMCEAKSAAEGLIPSRMD